MGSALVVRLSCVLLRAASFMVLHQRSDDVGASLPLSPIASHLTATRIRALLARGLQATSCQMQR
jgi:hypothetical protein